MKNWKNGQPFQISYFALCPCSLPLTLSPLSGDCRTMKLVEAIQNALEITLEKDPTAST